MTSPTTGQEPGGADLARIALRAARRTARLNGNTPVKKTAPSRQQVARAGRDAREPSALTAVVPAMASSQGWALGTAQGSMRDNWAQLVGAEAALHWYPAGFTPDTRTLRITCDSPAWATKLRLDQRQILANLNRARPDTVRALDIRVGQNTPTQAPEADSATVPSQRPASAPAAPLAHHPVYQQLREQMRDEATAREAALDEARLERDADREKWFRGHRGWLREPEGAQRTAAEDRQHQEAAALTHAREQLARHRAALAAARTLRTGTVPLRTTVQQPQPAPMRGAA